MNNILTSVTSILMATQTTYSYSPSARLFLLISGFTSIVRAEDKGDVVTDNLLTDFAPILALFGEKVTTQWLSGTFGWHDCLIFAVCPLGIITAVVSVIRVAAPNSWKAIVGRARESRALAELDLLSSTSDEVCELWSGQALVRVMGSPSVFEVAYIDDLKNQTTLGLHTIQEAKQILRNQKPGRTPVMIRVDKFSHIGRYKDIERGSDNCPAAPFSDNSNETSAPNISLNLGPSPKERRRVLFVSMVFGIIVQVGVLIYGALISYYKWKTNFLKDGATPPRFAYPILAAGTILLVFGMFLCAYVIEHHTAEDKWIVDPKTVSINSSSLSRATFHNPKIWLIWLQRGQTVNDQRFESYAICPPRPKDVLLTSRRIEKVGSVEPVHLQSKTIESDPASPFRTHAISGACITLVGFVLQFTGFRLMHWSATIAQFVATAIVTGLRVWLRRDLAERPAAQLIAKKFELDWFALNLAIRGKELWPSGIPSNGVHKMYAVNDVSTNRALWTVDSGKQGNGAKFIPHTEYHNDDASSVQLAFNIRERLGKLSQWRGRSSEVAVSTTIAIEAVMNTLFPDGSGFSDDRLVWTINATLLQSTSPPTTEAICLQLTRDSDTRLWRANTTEIEAILSLWIYAETEEREQRIQTTGVITEQDWVRWGDQAARRRFLRLLGPRTADSKRDLVWWIDDAVSKNVKIVRLEKEDSGKLSTDARLTFSQPYILGFSNFDYDAEEDGAWSNRGSECKESRNRILSKPCVFLAHDMSQNRANLDGEPHLAIPLNSTVETAYAQELFSAFMFSVAKSLIEPIGGDTVARQLPRASGGGIGISSDSLRLSNSLLDKLIRDVEQSGLASEDESPFLIIPPLSQARKLPEAYKIIDFVGKRAFKNEQYGNWKASGVLHMDLMDIAQGFGIDSTICQQSAARLLDFFRLICMMLKVWEEQKRTGGVVEELRGLKSKILDRLNSISPGLVVNLIMVYQLQGRKDIDEIPELNRSTWALNSEVKDTNKVRNNDPKFLTRSRMLASLLTNYRWEVKDFVRNKIMDPNATDIFGWTSLHYAASQGEDRVVEELLEEGADPQLTDIGGYAPMHYATRNISTALLAGDVTAAGRDGMTPLHCAAMRGNIQGTSSLIRAGASTSARDHTFHTPLHWAAYRGGADVCKQLLQIQGPHVVGLRDDYGRTPLHLAALSGDVDTAILLIEREKEFPDKYREDMIDRDRRTELHLAALANRKSVVELLMQHGRQVTTKDEFGSTAFHLAAAAGSSDILEHFLNLQNIDVNSIINGVAAGGKAPLHLAIESGVSGAVELLLHRDADTKIVDKRRQTPAHFAAIAGHSQILQLLLDHGADMNLQDVFSRTPLHQAAAKGHSAVVKLLLDRGADLNVEDFRKRVALHLAAEEGHDKTVELLLQHGANVHSLDLGGRNALHRTALNGHASTVQLLLDYGTDVHTRDFFEGTGLHVAACNGHDDTIRVLLAAGDDIQAKDDNGRSPLHRAAIDGHNHTIDVLLDEGYADLNARANGGRTTLHVAAENGNNDTVMHLLNRGADVNSPDDALETPLHSAAAKGHLETVRTLVKRGARLDLWDRKRRTPKDTAMWYNHEVIASLLDALAIEREALKVKRI